MAGKVYKAGTVYLQVLPVFGDLQNAIRREAKNANDALSGEMEKAGHEAGKKASSAMSEEIVKGQKETGRKAAEEYAGEFSTVFKAGLKKVQREIDPIRVGIDDRVLKEDFDAIKARIGELSKAKIGVDLDSKKAYAALLALSQQLDALQAAAGDIRVRTDIDEARKGVDAFVARIQRANPQLKIDVDLEPARKAVGHFEAQARKAARNAAAAFGDNLGPEVDALRRRLSSLSEIDVTPELNGSQIRDQLAEITRDIRKIAQESEIDFEVRGDYIAAFNALKAFNEYGSSIDGKHWDVTLDLNASEATREMGAFETAVRKAAKESQKLLSDGLSPTLTRIKSQLQDLSDQRITPELNAEHVRAEMTGLFGELKAIAQDTKLEADVRVNAASAYKTLAPLLAAFAAIDGRELNVDLDLDIGAAVAQLGLFSGMMAGVQAQSLGMTGSMGAAANSFRSFNIVVLGAVLLLPALIPMIGALGGGLLALIPIFGAVGAGLGAMIIGFSGIGNAVQAMGAAQDAAAKDTLSAANTMTSATNSVADAERALARARTSAAQASADAARAVREAHRSAAQAVKDALEAQADAERALADAQRDAAEAQENLRLARQRAREEIEQAADDRAQNSLDERQGVIDVFNATVNYEAVMADGSATNLDREQAAIALEQARLRLKEIRDEEKRLAKEKKRYDEQGIKGTEVYQSAHDALIDALERERDAQRAVGEAAQRVQEARIEGARRVADAIRNQRRVEAQGAQSVADAQRNLARAQAGYQAAAVQTGELGSAAMQNLQLAMDKLSPAGRRFALFIYSLRGYFRSIRDGIQEAMLPDIQRGLQALIDEYGPQFRNFAATMGGVVGGMFRDASRVLRGPSFKKFFASFAAAAPGLLGNFGKTMGAWAKILAELFTLIMPYAERLSQVILGISEAVLEWIKSKEGQDTIIAFMEYAFKIGPKVLDFFTSLVDAAIRLGVALAPWGAVILGLLDAIFDFISDMDPKLLGLLVSVAISLAIAFQLAVGAVAAFFAGMAIFAFTGATVVFAVAAIIGILIALYLRFEGVRDVVDVVLKFIVKAWNWAMKILAWTWENVLKPVLKAIWTAIKWTWKNVFLPVLRFIVAWWRTTFRIMKWAWDTILFPVIKIIWAVIKFLWKNIIQPIFGFIWKWIVIVFKAIKWAWNNLLYPVFDFWMTVIGKLWHKVAKPIFAALEKAWKLLSLAFRAVWQGLIKPIFDKFMETVEEFEPIFDAAVKAIGKAWEKIKSIIAKPIRWVIDVVINNGVIDGFNKIAGFVGSKKMERLPLPGAANGAVIPGYTPGRDIGYIGISGGEAVMRPEWTRVVGEDYVNQMNMVARLEGVDGLRRRMGYMGGFAAGGVVWPVPGRITYTYPGHDGVDINRGSGWDDYGDPVVSATSGVVSYVGTGRGYGQAIFVRSPYGELVYGHLSSERVFAGMPVKPGVLIGRVGNTGNSSAPHLHFGFPGGTYAAAMALLTGAGPGPGMDVGSTGSGPSLPGWISKLLGAPVKWFKNRIEGSLDRLSNMFGENGLVSMLTKIPLRLIDGVADKVMNMLEGRQSQADGSPVDANGVRAIVQAVAANFGWGGGAQWAAIDELVQRESSWNPNAANPTSSARGLFQKMTSIHGPLEPTVEGQARWGLNYIAGRYGTPTAALAFHNAHGYYRDGGVVEGGTPDNGAMMYDNGGYLPPGLTTVLNMTGKPEPVFTADQFEKIAAGAAGGGVTYAPTFVGTDLTAEDVADDLDHAFRKMARGGKYGSRV